MLNEDRSFEREGAEGTEEAAGKIMEGMIGKPWDYRLTIAVRRGWRASQIFV